MRRAMFTGMLSLAGLGVMVSAARALVIAMPQPGPVRTAQADAVVVGRVVALEDKDVQVQSITYRIAVVNVTETIKGAKEQMVRVGFVPPPVAPNPGGVPVPIRRPGFNPQYAVGQDGLFFLSKGPDGKFYTTSGFG